MATRIEKRLTSRGVMAATKAGRYPDGGGLYLVVSPPRKSWMWRYRRFDKRREMGLGSADRVTLAEARAERDKWRDVLLTGRDPIDQRERNRTVEAARRSVTFGDVATAHIAGLTHYKNTRHRDAWTITLDMHAATLKTRPVADVSTADVLAVLTPIWQTLPSTAQLVRSRIEAILDAARALGHIEDGRANPARWRGHLDKLLPRQRGGVQHHPAMEWGDVPAFVQRLRAANFPAARALEFLILTATRTRETLGARWEEIDLDAKVWTIPADRMKAAVPHRVPLTARALEVLAEVKAARPSAWVFHGVRPREPMSDRTLSALMRRWEVKATVHGFRSSFSSWRRAATSFDRELAELALAHAVGDTTERSYQRDDALERRRVLMDHWAAFIEGDRGARVIPMRAQTRP